MRGVVRPLSKSLFFLRGDQLAVIMWQKRGKNRNKVWIGTMDKWAAKGFDPLNWSILVYYNEDNLDGPSS